MSNLDSYAKNFRSIENAKRKRQEHPKGWEPGLNTAKKEIISEPTKKAKRPEDHKWDKYLEEHIINCDELSNNINHIADQMDKF